MKARRLLAIVAFSCLGIGLWVSPAGASPPIGNCPPAFEGPHTFAEVIEMWPPPPGFPDPEGALAFYDHNLDGSVCVRPLPNGVDINVIDNTVRLP